MTNNHLLAALLLSSLLGLDARAADVGVSVQISQPGVYGRVDIGRFPQPAVVMPQPVVIAPQPVVVAQPVYMWVPPGHQKNWRKHCSRYNACGVPVYFVQDRWYRQQVMQRERHGDRGHQRSEGRGKHRD
jgi:hypothetical protein